VMTERSEYHVTDSESKLPPAADFCRGSDPVSGAVEQDLLWLTDNRPCSDGASVGLGIQRVSVLVLLNLSRGD
jgi:hypothetical protein